MAAIPIIGKVTVGGAAKELSGGYVNIGGVWKPVVRTYVNVGGVWKPAWKNLYTWKKYTVVQVEGPPYTKAKNTTTSTATVYQTQTVYASSAYTFDSSTGQYTLTNASKVSPYSVGSSLKYWRSDAATGDTMREYVSHTSASANRKITYYTWKSAGTLSDAMGDYVADVTSENASAYPDNGKHTDGYWYVKQ